ncbi:MAG TPA: TonB family protein [Polyangiaceae bacterium]
MTWSNPDGEAMRAGRLLPWTIVASCLLHGVALASLAAAPSARVAKAPRTQLRFEVVRASQRLPAPPPAPAEPSEPAPPPPAPAPTPKLARAAPEPASAPAAPPLESPNAGVTLASTGDGAGNAIVLPLGDGGRLEPARARVAGAPVAAAQPARTVPVASEPVLVAVGDLSSRPSPPALGPSLERHYPAEARRGGLSGSAKVRARIDPDGVVRRVALLDESAVGFGSACSRALQGSRWGAPKDKAGRSVATEIRYTCRFVVQP